MGEDRRPEGPTRSYWFDKGYEQRRLDEAEEEDQRRSPLQKIAEEDEQNIARSLKRLKDLL